MAHDTLLGAATIGAPTLPSTTAEHFLVLLGAYGVEHLFLNPGTDSAPVQEAAMRLAGSKAPLPAIVPSTYESVSLAAAHGYFEVTGRPQCVFVHVDAGTQNLGAMLHDAYRDHAGVLIVAGLTPYGEDPSRPGGRTTAIHWQQDIADQAGIVRGYTKWAVDVAHPSMLARAVGRALRVAQSPPAGPCYMTVARDVFMAPPDLSATTSRVGRYAVPDPPALQGSAVDEILTLLAGAARPVLVTSRAGRSAPAFETLGRFAEIAGVFLSESTESRSVNVTTESPWLLRGRDAFETVLRTSDLVLLVDCDVPWVPSQCAPGNVARIVQIDPDPAKADMPLWAYPIDRSFQADGETALRQLVTALSHRLTSDPNLADACAHRVAALGAGLGAGPGAVQDASERRGSDGPRTTGMTLRELLEALDHALEPDDILVEEAVTNREAVRAQITRTQAGTRYGPGAPGLGWGLGGALGVKLASPGRRVVTVCGDGSFLFSAPTSALTMAAALGAPIGVVVIDNGGYRASRLPVYELFPEGTSVAARDAIATRFVTAPDYVKLAEACHAHGERVESASALAPALDRMLASLDAGRVSLLDVVVDQD